MPATDPRWTDETTELAGDALDSYYNQLGAGAYTHITRPYGAVQFVLAALADAGLLMSPAERKVLDAAREYELAWDIYANPTRHPGHGDDVKRHLAKSHAHQALLEAVRSAAVDALEDYTKTEVDGRG